MRAAQQLRQMQISEFCAWLRTQTNKHKRPFQEQTIIGYAETARVLDRWMTVQGIDSDFTACDVAVLNSRCTQHAKLRMAGDDRIPCFPVQGDGKVLN